MKRMQLKANLVSSNSPEFAAGGTISPSVIPVCLVTQCKASFGL